MAYRQENLFQAKERIEVELAQYQRGLPPNDTRLPQKLLEAARYIQDHLFDPHLNVNTLKLKCHLRNNNVSTIFRSVIGLSIREYIENLRLEAADQLLRSGGFEIYLIAMSVGYEHQETFFRAFQRRFGCTPSRRRSSFRCTGHS
jgi:AraC-like DNA-binding protein